MTVSAIIPNFNYARFLPRRIESILHQTIPPDEIIFLDDCSTDESVAVAEQLLSESSIPYRIFRNTENRGIFNQWLKGIELAEQEFFWIAEADDYCETTFLENLLPAFDDEAVILSYCQSKIMSVLGKDKGLSHENFAPYVDIEVFSRDYKASADSVLRDYLFILNTISNASAVVYRKSACDMDVLAPVKNFAYAGDWLFNLLLLGSNTEGKISFTARALNCWVHHPQSVWSGEPANADRRDAGSCEVIRIYLDLFDRHPLSLEQRFRILTLIYDLHLAFLMDRPEEHLFTKFCEKIYGPELASRTARFLMRTKRSEKEADDLRGKKDGHIAWLIRRLSRVDASLSWRITRPLRAVHDLFKRPALQDDSCDM